MKIHHSQELAEFHQTQIGRSVKEGISNVTVFHERTPTDARSILFTFLNLFLFTIFSRRCSDPYMFLGVCLSPFQTTCPWGVHGGILTAKDVLEWLKDFGNAFNKAASKPSCIEHLLALGKIEPAIQQHLQQFVPKMTSSHKDYEKTVKMFLDNKFPQRFASFREYQSASAFRNRMTEHGLWENFINFANHKMDFQKAGELDNGLIYKTCNVVARKLLAFAPKNPKEGEYTWADLALSVLKFAIPCSTVETPSGGSDWTIPFSLSKSADLEKIEFFLAPMKNSRAAKLPETLKEEREKAAEKALSKKPKKCTKNKATRDSAKRSADQSVDTEEFHANMTDSLGNVRLTLLGDDILNAINYTVEKLSFKQHRKDAIIQAIDLAVLFTLEGNLDAAGSALGITKVTSWSKARQTIKAKLNRSHALAARLSDPDLYALPGVEKGATEEMEAETEADLDKLCKKLGQVLKIVNEKSFCGFLEDNFVDFTDLCHLDTAHCSKCRQMPCCWVFVCFCVSCFVGTVLQWF